MGYVGLFGTCTAVRSVSPFIASQQTTPDDCQGKTNKTNRSEKTPDCLLLWPPDACWHNHSSIVLPVVIVSLELISEMFFQRNICMKPAFGTGRCGRLCHCCSAVWPVLAVRWLWPSVKRWRSCQHAVIFRWTCAGVTVIFTYANSCITYNKLVLINSRL